MRRALTSTAAAGLLIAAGAGLWLAAPFTRPAAAQSGYSGFYRSLNDKPYAHQVVGAPQPVRAGEKAQRFEVRPGDCGRDGGWSDCENDRERIELSGEPHFRPGEERWLAWSVYLPADYPDVFPTSVSLGQVHQIGPKTGPSGAAISLPPLLQFDLEHGRYALRFHKLSPTGAEIVETVVAPTIALADMRGRWTDVMLQVRFARETGFARVYLNGVLRAEIGGDLIQIEPQSFYFKFGLYRSFVSKYKAAFKRDAPTQIVYFDEVRTGASRAAVDLNGGAPPTPVD